MGAESGGCGDEGGGNAGAETVEASCVDVLFWRVS